MSTPNPTQAPSALPAAMQARMVRLQADMGGNSGQPAAATGNEPPAGNEPPQGVTVTPPAAGPQGTPGDGGTPTGTTPPAGNGDGGNTGDRITISREEYDDMRAAAGRVRAMQAREEVNADRLAELTQRLTELENGNKPSSTAPASTPSAPSSTATGAPVIDTTGITFTDEENNEYGDSRPYIEKVVDLRVAAHLNQLVPGLRQMVEDAKKQAEGAANTVQTVQTRSFMADVLKAVPDQKDLIKHKHWEAFIDEIEPMSGVPYDQLLAHHVRSQNLSSVTAIYDTFRKKYVGAAQQEQQNTQAGYAGASPSGTAVNPPAQPGTPTKLKLSDRKKASLDYRQGRITFAQLEEVNKQFDEADKKGLVDYDA